MVVVVVVRVVDVVTVIVDPRDLPLEFGQKSGQIFVFVFLFSWCCCFG